MSLRFPLALFLAIITACAGIITGCNRGNPDPVGGDRQRAAVPDPGTHHDDPHDVPLSDEQKAELRRETARFPDAVAKIRELTSTVEEETRHGIPENPFQAHRALDEVDLVLQWLPEIARDSGLAKEHWEEVNTTANDLRTLLEQVHQNIDERQDPNFAGIADETERKITRLQELAATELPAQDGES